MLFPKIRNLRLSVIRRLLKQSYSLEDVNYARLNGAELNGAELNYARLNGAELTGAKLNRAKLNGAELNRAKLNGAELNYAELNGAELNYARLNGAELNRAKLNRAKLNGAELNGAVGLPIKILQFSCIGSRNSTLTVNLSQDLVWTGCFSGTLSELWASVKLDHHTKSNHYHEYRLAIEYCLKFSTLLDTQINKKGLEDLYG